MVKYYKTFLEGESVCVAWPFFSCYLDETLRAFDPGDRLYVVMELIEGEPLAEHFASLREKQQRFTEERIWNIFIQVGTFLVPENSTQACVSFVTHWFSDLFKKSGLVRKTV